MTKNHISQLARLLGKTKVSTRSAILEQHAGDRWHAARQPQAVVFAQTTQDVSRLLHFASKRRIAVTARASGTGHVGSCVPAKGGIVLSLARMNRIKKISVADGLAIVQPGVITAKLQTETQKRGLFYPPDPASLNESAIGGNIATNAGGPRCLKYGTTRHYILALEVVLANGQIIRTGSRTVKNKTGFALEHLFVGSEGMLGVVTEATLRLLPQPPARGVLIGAFLHARQAAQTVLAIQKAGLLPSALEIADAFTLQAARCYTKNVPPGNAFVLVEVDGLPQTVRAEITAISSILKQQKALKIIRARGQNNCERLWDMRRTFSDALKATGLKKWNEDVVVPRGKIVELFALAEKMHRRTGIPVSCFGHAGDGNIHVNIMAPPEFPDNQPPVRAMLDELFTRVIRWNGSITGEHGIGLAKKRWWPQAVSPALQALHLQVKNTLDPLGILNPGKFLDP